MTGLDISAVNFDLGAKRVLSHVTFTVAPGAFCALLGPNGAGKSTLFALLTGLFSTHDGVISVAGHNMRHATRQALARIGVVFQQSTLDPDLSVRRNLLYFAALHGLAGARAADRATEVLALMEMAHRADERVRDLNGGHRRRVEIARALMHKPDILLLDEPTVGLDAATRALITAHVHGLCDTQGLTVLWATHLTDEVYPADQVVVLHQGRVLTDQSCATMSGTGSLNAAFLALTQVAV